MTPPQTHVLKSKNIDGYVTGTFSCLTTSLHQSKAQHVVLIDDKGTNLMSLGQNEISDEKSLVSRIGQTNKFGLCTGLGDVGLLIGLSMNGTTVTYSNDATCV